MSERSFKTSGIRIGRIYGIDLWIHWSLLLWFAYILFRAWQRESSLDMILRTGIWWAAVLATISVHELGHCAAAAWQGGGADAIVLWPLGGLAFCDAPHLPRNQFWVAAGGPLAQLVPMGAAGAVIWGFGIGGSAFPDAGEPYISVALGAFFWWNLLILGFNLFPVYPFDGGRILQAILWGKLQSYGRATKCTVWTSRILIFVGFVVTLFLMGTDLNILSVVILIWALLKTEELNARLASGEESEDYVFGYDFSGGYTSLERTATREKPRSRISLLQRLKFRSLKSREMREAEVGERVDYLLEKISREGMASLSWREKRFLKQASKKYKRHS